MLTPRLCTVGWFAITEPQDTKKIQNLFFSISKHKNSVTNLSNTLFNQKSPVHQVPGATGRGRQKNDKQTDIATCRLNQPKGQFSENVLLNGN